MARRPPANDEVGLSEIAKLLGLSVRQVDNLAAEGLPRHKDGNKYRYPAGACVQWYVQRRTAKAGRGPAGEPAHQSAKQRKLVAEARRAELEVAQLEKTLVALDTFELELSGILERIRARLLAAPQKFAPRIVGLRTIPEALTALEPAFAELMAECSRTAHDVEAGEHVAGEASADNPPPRRHPPRRARRAS